MPQKMKQMWLVVGHSFVFLWSCLQYLVLPCVGQWLADFLWCLDKSIALASFCAYQFAFDHSPRKQYYPFIGSAYILNMIILYLKCTWNTGRNAFYVVTFTIIYILYMCSDSGISFTFFSFSSFKTLKKERRPKLDGKLNYF